MPRYQAAKDAIQALANAAGVRCVANPKDLPTRVASGVEE